MRRWIDFFGETAGEKQTLNIDISGLASVLDRGDAVQLMCYFLSWAIEFDREEFVNHQVHMVLRKLLVHVYSTARSTCDACPCKKTIVRCGENIKRLRRTIPSYLCVAVLISCIQIGEHAHGSSSSHFVDYLCSTKFVISTEIDPIVDLFASLDCTEEMRQCLLRNQVNSLALAVTLVVIERYDYLHLQLSKRNIDIPVSLETLQSDRSTLEKNQTCVLWKYEPLIDSWVRKSPTLPQYRRSSISTADSFIIDSSRISLSSPRPNHLCSSPCPLTSTSP